MEKYIFDEGNGLWYELQGDYYIPCLTVPAQNEDHRHLGTAVSAFPERTSEHGLHRDVPERNP